MTEDNFCEKKKVQNSVQVKEITFIVILCQLKYWKRLYMLEKKKTNNMNKKICIKQLLLILQFQMVIIKKFWRVWQQAFVIPVQCSILKKNYTVFFCPSTIGFYWLDVNKNSVLAEGKKIHHRIKDSHEYSLMYMCATAHYLNN